MANSFMLQHTNSPPLTLFLRNRNVGVVDNVRFCQTRINDHGGSAGLSLQMIRQKSVIAPSLKIRAQHASSGDDSSWELSNANEMEVPNLVKLSFLDVEQEKDLKDILAIFREDGFFRYWKIDQVLERFNLLCTRAEVDIAYGMIVRDATDSVIFPLMDDICNTLFSMAKAKADVWIHSHNPGQPGGEGPTTLGVILILLTDPLKKNAKCVKEFVTSFSLKFNDNNTAPQDCFQELFSSVTTFNENLASVYQAVLNYTYDGYFELEGEPIKFDRNKSKLLKQNMLQALENRLPYKARSTVGIVGQLGYSLLEYIDILQVLKKLK